MSSNSLENVNAALQLEAQVDEAQMQNNTISTVARMKTMTRCPNTTKAYSKRQRRFLDYCRRTSHPSGSLVTEAKLIDFLQNDIIPFGNRQRSKRGEFRPDGTPYPLSASSIDQYVKAIVDLYADQKSSMIGITLQTPRGTLLKSYLRSLRLQEATRLKQSYKDRGAGTLQDGYTPEELVRVSMYYFNQATEASMRDRATFLMQHTMLLRGESTRRMELPDLFMREFEDEGYSECPALVLVMREGKTNHTGKVEYAATIRHKDVKRCAFGALALYFFTRWHIANEPFPSFRENGDWFDIKVLKSNKGHPTDEIDYKTQYNSICKAFNACGINSIKKTHAGRGSGARHAEIAGASEDQLRRHGRWNAQSMENNYLTNFPRQSIRVINGFPGQGKQFWLPRSSLSPPLPLQQKIFPWIETILPLIENGYEDEQHQESTSGYPKTICGQAFLNLLKTMRVILLQDSVFLRVDFPQNSMFCNPIFQNPEFCQYEAALLEMYRTQESPQEMKLKDIVPELEQVITSLSQKVDAVTGLIVNSNGNHPPHPPQPSLTGVQEDISAIKNSLNGINMSFDQLKTACSYFASNGALPRPLGVHAHNDTEIDNNNNPTTVGSVTASATTSTVSTTDTATATATATTSSSIPQYTMQKWLRNVKDLWHEFSIGFKIGDVQYESIEELNRKYKNEWRKTEKARKFYSRRIYIINAIKQLSENNGGDIEAAIAEIEKRRAETDMSLYKLNEILKNEQQQ